MNLVELLLVILALVFSRGEATPLEIHNLVDEAAATAGVVIPPTATVTPTITKTAVVTTTAVAVTNWPTTAQEFLSWVTKGQPAPDGSWLPIELVEVHRPVGEPNSWAVAREKDLNGNIVPFWVRNPTNELQDGWMHNKLDRDNLGRKEPESARGSGIPAGWSGLVQGATFRP